MAKNTKNRKTINIPKPDIPEVEKIKLPFNGDTAIRENLKFSFVCFDRTHALFNLGDTTTTDKTVNGSWFLDLLDCLKDVSNKKVTDLNGGKYDIHPIDWSSTNAKAPDGFEQLEYQQFRINKSKGRIIGFIIGNVFYIVWLDRHHNLTDSEGYGKATWYTTPKSEYEVLIEENKKLKEENKQLKEDLEEFLLV